MGAKASKKLIKKLDQPEVARIEQLHRMISGGAPAFTADQLMKLTGMPLKLCQHLVSQMSTTAPMPTVNDLVLAFATLEKSPTKDKAKLVFAIIDVDNDKRLNKEDLTIWCSLSFKVNAPGAPPEALTILEQPAAQAKAEEMLSKSELKDKTAFTWHDCEKSSAVMTLFESIVDNLDRFMLSLVQQDTAGSVSEQKESATLEVPASKASRFGSKRFSMRRKSGSSPKLAEMAAAATSEANTSQDQSEKLDSEKAASGTQKEPGEPNQKEDGTDSTSQSSSVFSASFDFSDDEEEEKKPQLNIRIASTSLISAQEAEQNSKALAAIASQISMPVGGIPSRGKSLMRKRKTQSSTQELAASTNFASFDAFESAFVQSPSTQAADALREAMTCMELAEYSKGLASVQRALEALGTSQQNVEERMQCVAYKVALQLLCKIQELRCDSHPNLDTISLLSHLLAGIPLKRVHRAVCIRICIHCNIEANNSETAIRWMQQLIKSNPPDQAYLQTLLETEEQKLKQQSAFEPATYKCKCSSRISVFSHECSSCGAPGCFDFTDFTAIQAGQVSTKCGVCCATFAKPNVEQGARCPTCMTGVLQTVA